MKGCKKTIVSLFIALFVFYLNNIVLFGQFPDPKPMPSNFEIFSEPAECDILINANVVNIPEEGYEFSSSVCQTFSAFDYLGMNKTQSSSQQEIRYRFDRWESGEDQTYEICPALFDPRNFTDRVYYVRQYLLTLAAEDQRGNALDEITGNPQGAGFYDVGSTATFSVDNIWNASDGERFLFERWEGRRKIRIIWLLGGYSGTDNPASTEINGILKETSVWQRQYKLTTHVDPSGAGVVHGLPGTVGITSAWYDQWDRAKLWPRPSEGYQFDHWSGDVDSLVADTAYVFMTSSRDVTAHFVRRPVTVTIESTPESVEIRVDDVPHTTPWTSTDWRWGIEYSLSATEIVNKGGERLVFRNWAPINESESSFNYTTSGNQTLTIEYDKEYYLDVNSGFGQPYGEGWYPEGDNASFGISSPDNEGAGIQKVFFGWTGAGSGSYTGSETNSTVVMNNAITETASWKTQYYLSTSVNPAQGGTIEPAPPGGWFDENTDVVFNADAAPDYLWIGWSGALNGRTRPETLRMTAPFSVTANFSSAHGIAILTDPDGLEFIVDNTVYSKEQFFLWEGGSRHTLSVQSPQSLVEGERHVFSSWSDGGEQTHEITASSSISEISALFTTQYSIQTDVSPPGAGSVSIVPDGIWFDKDSEILVAAIPDLGNGFKFERWTGDVSGSENPMNLLIDQPFSLTANFSQNYAPVIGEHPDLIINEDDTLTLSMSLFMDSVSDPDHAVEDLKLDLSGNNHVLIQLDPDGKDYRFFGEPDWNGSEAIVITISDPLNATDRDTMWIQIVPVPDPPFSFSLLLPTNGSDINGIPDSVRFVWESAFDPDVGDVVVYDLYLASDSSGSEESLIDFRHVQSDTQFIYPKEIFSGYETVFWWVKATDGDELATGCEKIFRINNPLAFVQEYLSEHPKSFALYPGYPNPFNHSTMIEYDVPRDQVVLLEIYNIQGKKIKTLKNGFVEVGRHHIRWNGIDEFNRCVSSGNYFIQMKCDNFQHCRKILFMK